MDAHHGGVGLLSFAGGLGWLLLHPRLLRHGAWLVIAADAAWTIGAILLLTTVPDILSPAGRIALVATTVVVGLVAAAQRVGLARLGTSIARGTVPVMFSVERVLDAPKELVWAAVADAGSYARYAPGIASSSIVTGERGGMVRVCSDGHGGEWSETCTLWEEGTRYRMTVEVDSYPARYRALFADLAQTWSVEPVGVALTSCCRSPARCGSAS